MTKRLTITIDGPAGAGRHRCPPAKRLGYTWIRAPCIAVALQAVRMGSVPRMKKGCPGSLRKHRSCTGREGRSSTGKMSLRPPYTLRQPSSRSGLHTLSAGFPCGMSTANGG